MFCFVFSFWTQKRVFKEGNGGKLLTSSELKLKGGIINDKSLEHNSVMPPIIYLHFEPLRKIPLDST